MDILKILENRGINETTISNLGWRISNNWLEMPVIKNGVEVGFKARKFGDDKAFMQKKGTPQIFYNFDALSADVIVITEGELDCAVALQCGYDAVSVPSGAPNERLEDPVKKYGFLDDLPEKTQVILAFDDDQAGYNLLHDVSNRIGVERCKWVKYPNGMKDLNEVLISCGSQAVRDCIDQSRWIEVDGLSDFDELPPPVEMELIDCPVAGMAEYYKLRLGDFTVITGIPGMGKTTFTNEIAADIAKNHHWKVCIASFEQPPRNELEPWLCSFYHNKPYKLQTAEQKREAQAWLKNKFKVITRTENSDSDLKWLIDRIKVAALRYGCKLIIIDPWNEMDHLHPREMTQTEYTGFAIKTLKKLAAKLNIHLIIVTHPAKMSRNKEGAYPVPSLYDIADSAHWRNKADMGIVVHRPKPEETKIMVQKCRYWGKIGKAGEVEVRYDDYQHRFLPL
jgi:twinkle protein